MKKFTKVAGIAFLLNSTLCLTHSYALEFPTLSDTQLDNVFGFFGAFFAPRMMEPPSHPSKFGFFFSVRANGSSMASVASLFNAGTGLLPYASIQAGVSGPFGLGIETTFLPTISVPGSGFSAGSFGAALKWNILTGLSIPLPLDITVRGIYNSASLTLQQTLSGVPVTINYTGTMMGGTLDVGKHLLFIDPYVGIGYMSAGNKIGGAASLFDGSVNASAGEFSKSLSSVWFHAGLEMKLTLATLGFQYDRVFGIDTVTAKTGFRF